MTTIIFLMWTLLWNDSAQQEQAGNIELHVLKVSEKKGEILVALYADPKSFPDKPEKAVRLARGKAQNGKAVIVLEQIPAGKYAISVFHDTNGDEKLNYNLVGAPTEGYGFSNDARKMFSAPGFQQAMFVHQKNTKVEINIRY